MKREIPDIALTLTPGIGPKGAVHLLDVFGSAEAVFSASADELIEKARLRPELARAILQKKAFADAEREVKHCRKHGIEIIASTDAQYPALLRETADYPHVLYVLGSPEALGKTTLTMVGTRRMTPYGQQMADRLIGELADRVAEYLQRSFHALSSHGDLWAWKTLPSEGTGYLDALPDAPPLPWGWLSQAEFDRFVQGYNHPDPMLRFIGGLNSYRTADANWEIGLPWADADVTVPTLFLYGADDPSFAFFPDWEPRLRLRVPGLRGITVIDGAGHLVQQEQSDAFNAALIGFIKSL